MIEAEVYASINRFRESGGLLQAQEGETLTAYSLGTLQAVSCPNPACPYSAPLVEPEVEDR